MFRNSSNDVARVISCDLLPTTKPLKACEPLLLSKKPETLTVAPYLSEVPVDATALFSKRSPQESRDGWKAATENRMREMARIVRWKDATTQRLLREQLTVGLSPLPRKDHRIADFDRSNPQLFVQSHWQSLPKVSVIATHKYLIVPLLTACKGDWFWKMGKHRHAVDNGAVLETTWTKDGVNKIIFFVRHCVSCANFLKERGKGQQGSKATMCLNVEAIRALFGGAVCFGLHGLLFGPPLLVRATQGHADGSGARQRRRRRALVVGLGALLGHVHGLRRRRPHPSLVLHTPLFNEGKGLRGAFRKAFVHSAHSNS